MVKSILTWRINLAANSLVRTTEKDLPANLVLAQALQSNRLPVIAHPAPSSNGVDLSQSPKPTPSNDYTLLDPSLKIDAKYGKATLPSAGLGYAGFTAQQRAAFLDWLDDCRQPGHPAFQQLLVANLEVHLFGEANLREKAQRELIELDLTPAWQGNEWLDRAILLSFWLTQNGAGLSRWLTNASVVDNVLTLGLGHLALLHEKFSGELATLSLRAWKLPPVDTTPAVLTLWLNSLAVALGADPLSHALATLGESANQPLAWRCAHRDLRIALPQPNLRPVLELLLRELLANNEHLQPDETVPTLPEPEEPPAKAAPAGKKKSWVMVLEFEYSRSSYYEFAVEVAKKLENYQLFMDENRQLVHRIRFENKSKLRDFWRLWNWVQPWSGTRVFVNDRELQKWQVVPGSHDMK